MNYAMDWTICLICQECTTEPLKCPLNAHGNRDKSEPYDSFLNNVNAFRALGKLPVLLYFGEDMTVNELVQNQAAWHKSCYVKFSNEKLERATRKRDRSNSAESILPGMKRHQRQPVDKMACLFCQQQDGCLHEFRTLEADETIRLMATELQDTELMARIEGGDLVALEAKYHLQCLTALRNCYRSLTRQHDKDSGGVF